MIRNTFCLLNGIGEKLERRLWRNGILTWEDFIESPYLDFVSPGRKELFNTSLKDAEKNLNERNASYFKNALSIRDHWRLFEEFKDKAVCIDIETNGYQAGRGGYPTIVGLYDGFNYKHFVWGKDLSAENLTKTLSRYKYIITFFGSAFDIPYLERTFSGFKIDMPHFDLCFGARKVGYKGGLKKIEVLLGIERVEETKGMNGYDAVLLWEKSKRGSTEALSLLLKYNREDTVNLFRIAETVYGQLKTATGIEKFI